MATLLCPFAEILSIHHLFPCLQMFICWSVSIFYYSLLSMSSVELLLDDQASNKGETQDLYMYVVEAIPYLYLILH